jgi:hypothetical protein
LCGVHISVRLQRKQDNNTLKVTLVSIPKKPKTNTTRTSAVITFITNVSN